MLLYNILHISNLKIIYLSLFNKVLGNHFSISLIIIKKTFSFSLIVIFPLSILLFFSQFALCVLLKIELSHYSRYEFYFTLLEKGTLWQNTPLWKILGQFPPSIIRGFPPKLVKFLDSPQERASLWVPPKSLQPLQNHSPLGVRCLPMYVNIYL